MVYLARGTPGFPVQEEREEHLRVQRQADAYSPEELGDILDKYDAKSPPPACNPLTKPFPFNLMFKVRLLVQVLNPSTGDRPI